MIYSHGSYEGPKVDSEDLYKLAKTKIPSFTTLFFRTDFNDTVIHPECKQFLTGKIYESALKNFGKVEGGREVVDYTLSQSVSDNFEAIDMGKDKGPQALLYDFVSAKAGSKAKLSDVWDLLERKSLRYAFVQGWFCRVSREYRTQLDMGKRDSKGRLDTRPGEKFSWDLGNSN